MSYRLRTWPTFPVVKLAGENLGTRAEISVLTFANALCRARYVTSVKFPLTDRYGWFLYQAANQKTLINRETAQLKEEVHFQRRQKLKTDAKEVRFISKVLWPIYAPD